MKKLYIQVRQHDIDGAVCRDAKRCVIANAIKRERHLEEHIYPTVRANGVAWTEDGLRYTGRLARTAAKNLVDFDQTGTCKPFGTCIQNIVSKPIPPKATEDRKRQINDARKARKEAGQPDKKYPKNTGRIYGL